MSLSAVVYTHRATTVHRHTGLPVLLDHVLSLGVLKANASAAHNLEAANCCVNHRLQTMKSALYSLSASYGPGGAVPSIQSLRRGERWPNPRGVKYLQDH